MSTDMGSDSILDLDEARRRLQQMDREHADVVQLVGKLREVHRSLESHVRLLEDRAESAEERLARLRILVRALRNRGTRLQCASEQALSDLEKERLRAAQFCDSQRASLEQCHAQWRQEQRALVETAVHEQASQTAVLARSWEQEQSQLREELAELRREMDRRLGALTSDWKQELAAVNTAFESRLHARLNDNSRDVGQDLVSVRHEVQSLINRRTYVAATAIGASLFLAAYGLLGRTSPSATHDSRGEARASAAQDADATPTSATAPQAQSTAVRSTDSAVEQTRSSNPTAGEKSLTNPLAAGPPAPFAAPAANSLPVSPALGEDEASTGPTSEPLPRTRVWTDYLGRSAAAEFEDFRDGIVYLKSRATGRVSPIPLEQLSVPDQAYVRGLVAWRR